MNAIIECMKSQCYNHKCGSWEGEMDIRTLSCRGYLIASRCYMKLHEQIINIFQGFRRDAHPKAMMVGVMGALSSFYQDTLDINDAHQRQEATRRIIAKSSTIGAMAYKYSIGQAFVSPKNLSLIHI